MRTRLRQVLKVGFEQAMLRKKVLHNIHKSNVLMSSVFWNEILEEVRDDYPEVEVKHMLVDAAATALCLNPGQFDVMVMENMFGDILSDQGGGILGSLSHAICLHRSRESLLRAIPRLCSRYRWQGHCKSLLDDRFCGDDARNGFGMIDESKAVWAAMKSVFEVGYSTSDLSNPDSGTKIVSTEEFGDLVMEKLGALLAN